MKILLALTAIISTVALGSSATGFSSASVRIIGTVDPVFSVSSGASSGNGTSFLGDASTGNGAGRVVTLANFVNAEGVINSFSGQTPFNVICNTRYLVTVTSANGGLQAGSGTPIPYAVSLGGGSSDAHGVMTSDLGSSSTALQASYGSASESSSGSTVIVHYQYFAGNSVAAPGTYTDTLNLTFLPQQ
jgi:hypothetical protein